MRRIFLAFLTVIKKELSFGIMGVLAGAEVKSNNIWWNLLIFFLLEFILFFLVLLVILASRCKNILSLLHTFGHHCNLRLLCNLREIERSHFSKTLDVTGPLRIRHQLSLFDELFQVN